MVCVPLSPLTSPVVSRSPATTLPFPTPEHSSSGPVNRISIGSESRDVALARLRARLLRMIVENERVRNELRIRPR
jgi:hypothetical protein